MTSPADVAKTLAPKKSVKGEKKPYIRKEHLTSKPFRDDEALQKFRQELSSRKNHPAGKGRRK